MPEKLLGLIDGSGLQICFETVAALFITFILTLLSMNIVIPVLVKKKMGQNINEYVSEHKNKQGTPTMGGIGFIIPILIVILVRVILGKFGVFGLASPDMIPLAMTVCLGVGCAMIGFIDDYAKLLKKKNEGLKDWQKLLLQLVITSAYLIVMGYTNNLPTALRIPFTSFTLELGWVAYPIYLLVIVGFENSTNITDGLDGLASSIGISVGCIIAFMSVVFCSISGGLISGALIGGLLGFLVFNHYPAKVFMGDTGSLFLGGIIMGVAVSEGELLCVIIASFVFVAEMLSSLLQRVYFKLTHGKRLFKMAPLHHHFQKMGWGEVKIVTLFFIVSMLLSIIGALGIIIPGIIK